jgi:DNA polymerase-4
MSEAMQPQPRKIIHIDMDAFYASVEQRDDASLRGKPVVVAWKGERSVVCAASYEARQYGIRSAMSAIRAERLCPNAIFVPPDFVRYKAASKQMREIFQRYTDLIEPLSLDEAYLDVTQPKLDLGSATAIAQRIREQIRAEIHLVASAGVAPNKLLAKIASDWRKPDGLFVIRPSQVESFLTPLPVGKIHGVGKVMQAKLTALGISTVGDLRLRELMELEQRFGRFGRRLYECARGIDNRVVQPNQRVKSISSEDTFAIDVPLTDLEDAIRRLAEKTWTATRKTNRVGRTVVLKLKTADFQLLTRSYTPQHVIGSVEELIGIALLLRNRIELSATTRYRLVGVGLSGFVEPDEVVRQGELFM